MHFAYSLELQRLNLPQFLFPIMHDTLIDKVTFYKKQNHKFISKKQKHETTWMRDSIDWQVFGTSDLMASHRSSEFMTWLVCFFGNSSLTNVKPSSPQSPTPHFAAKYKFDNSTNHGETNGTHLRPHPLRKYNKTRTSSV